MKNLHFSKPMTDAKASPSIGWYLDSAGAQKRLPTYTVCQPSEQQPGSWSPGQEQCFCVSHHPIPSFAQSVARAVGNLGSKDLTPFSHWRIISSFEASKASCRS